MSEEAIVVWAEIPVTDMEAAKAFYTEVFGFQVTMDDSGPNPQAILGGGPDVAGAHLYPGKPAGNGTGPTVHLAVPDKLEASMARCGKAGGTVLSDAIQIPPGRFAYALDLDGNSIGLFEPAG